jgi:hypothetical protein
VSVLVPLLLAASGFVEVTDLVGLDFVHDVGEEDRFYYPAVMGAGVAFLDYDNDSDLDIYLVQSGRRKSDQLFRQDEGGRFVNVTEAAGIAETAYGMGVTAGDVDNDGNVDLFVTNYGPNVLYRNLGKGRFEDATATWGISGDSWSASATFCDYDADGFLDLYVTRYLANDPTRKCTQADGTPDFCAPEVFPGISDTLYHNEKGRKFRDVSVSSGIGAARSRGLGVICADLIDDGKPDFFVANDGEANQLWVNQGNGTFVEEAFLQGLALDGQGHAEAGMGIALGDVDSDSDLDLFVTHIVNEMNTLFTNLVSVGFEDRTAASGLGALSLAFTGFGVGFFDFDHDADLDIAVANGRILRRPGVPGSFWEGYAEPNRILENDGSGKFRAFAGEGDFGKPVEVSRGLAFGDYDSDGDVDLLVQNTAAKARLFRNDAAKQGDWLIVRAFEPQAKRDAHGARIKVTAGGKLYVRLASPGGSYLSSQDPRAHFGLPKSAKIDSIEILWPDGKVESFPAVETNRTVTLSKGTGARR